VILHQLAYTNSDVWFWQSQSFTFDYLLRLIARFICTGQIKHFSLKNKYFKPLLIRSKDWGRKSSGRLSVYLIKMLLQNCSFDQSITWSAYRLRILLMENLFTIYWLLLDLILNRLRLTIWFLKIKLLLLRRS